MAKCNAYCIVKFSHLYLCSGLWTGIFLIIGVITIMSFEMEHQPLAVDFKLSFLLLCKSHNNGPL